MALGRIDEFTVVGAVSRASDIVPTALRCGPTVLLVDPRLRSANRVERDSVLLQMRRCIPGCGIVLLSTTPQQSDIETATSLRARGVVSKHAGFGHLVDVIKAASSGVFIMSDDMTSIQCGGSSPLAQREASVLRGIAERQTVREIARDLSLAEGSVRNLASSAMRKLGAANRHEAADLAFERGWL